MAIFNVDVGFEDPRKQWTVRHNPFIVDFDFSVGITNFHIDFGFDTTIFWSSSSIQRIPIFTGLCVIKKLSWKSFGALSFFHAGRAGIDLAARTVNHIFNNYVKQTAILFRIG